MILNCSADGSTYVTQQGLISDVSARIAEMGIKGCSTAKSSSIIVQKFQGRLEVITGNSSNSLSLDDLHVLDFAIVPSTENQTVLAVLGKDTKPSIYLTVYTLKNNNLHNKTELKQLNDANMIVPLQDSLLILGATSITHFDFKRSYTFNFNKVIQFCCYSVLDETRILLSELLGGLYVLLLTFGENNEITDMELEKMGETSPATSITYLTSGLAFVGSHVADSQLIHLESDPEDGEYVKIIQTYPNLAPSLDLSVIDPEKQDQGQLVISTCSDKYGTLRILRNGIKIDELGEIPVSGLLEVFTIKESQNGFDDTILLSLITETKIFSAKGIIAEVSATPFEESEATLVAGNMFGNYVVQVTQSKVLVLQTSNAKMENPSRRRTGYWSPDLGFVEENNMMEGLDFNNDLRINHAAITPTQICVVVGRSKVVLLEFDNGKITEVGSTTFDYDVSALDMSADSDGLRAKCVTVALWTELSVFVLAVPNLAVHTKKIFENGLLCQSLLMTKFEDTTYLFVSLGDGQLINFQVNLDSPDNLLTNQKRAILGKKPIKLKRFLSRDEKINIFAACDKPTIIHASLGKLVYSSVNLKEANTMCPLHVASAPFASMISTNTQLKFGRFQGIQKLHFRNCSMRELVRRLAYQESSNTFAVVSEGSYHANSTPEERKERVGGGWRGEGCVERAFLRLISEGTLEVLDTIELLPNEVGQSMLSARLGEDPFVYYVIGTGMLNNEKSGRIIVAQVFNTSGDDDIRGKRLKIVCDIRVNGSVYSLKTVSSGVLVAAVNNQVEVFKWTNEQASNVSRFSTQTTGAIRGKLSQICQYLGQITNYRLSTFRNTICVGDLMKSVTFLRYDQATQTLQKFSKDYETRWVTSLCMMNENQCIMGDHYGNLVVFRGDSEQATVLAEVHVGSMINHIVPGSLVSLSPFEKQVAYPEFVFGTVDGMVGVISRLDPETYKILWQLETNLAATLESIGETHEMWRAYKDPKRITLRAENDLPSKQGMIDGDLIERLLDLTKEEIQVVLDGKESGMFKIDASVEDVIRLVEELSRLK
ncbi:hypothetical protein HK098_000519 [Nowakowskiella sp. JEL0407]|nr:hypothetical protein HK098_000519 [Nowakowskiella sp. JEL0407]